MVGPLASQDLPAAVNLPRPATVTIGRNDRGRTIGLEVGDHLELTLGPPSPSPSVRGIGPLRWTLASYPNDLLVLEDQDATQGRFRFTAKAAGQGRIVLGGLGDPCRPPRLCPMKPPAQSAPSGHCPRLVPPAGPDLLTSPTSHPARPHHSPRETTGNAS